jgi:hypothetical protein
MSQLTLFETEEIKRVKILKPPQREYKFPYDLDSRTDLSDNRKAAEKYSPYQMKLWAWLKKNVGFEYGPNFNHYYTSAQLKSKYKGRCIYSGMSGDPQKLVSQVFQSTYQQTFWNFRHQSRGQVKWKNLPINLKIYFREHYEFNFSDHYPDGQGGYDKSHFTPSDTHYLFCTWYCMEYGNEPDPKPNQNQIA